MIKTLKAALASNNAQDAIETLKNAFTVNKINVNALFNKAAEHHDQIFYINRLGQVDTLDHIQKSDVKLLSVAEAKMAGLARNEKPGRLIAAFNAPKQAVHFYINPKSSEQLGHVKSLISGLYFNHDNHKNMLLHLEVVRPFD